MTDPLVSSAFLREWLRTAPAREVASVNAMSGGEKTRRARSKACAVNVHEEAAARGSSTSGSKADPLMSSAFIKKLLRTVSAQELASNLREVNDKISGGKKTSCAGSKLFWTKYSALAVNVHEEAAARGSGTSGSKRDVAENTMSKVGQDCSLDKFVPGTGEANRKDGRKDIAHPLDKPTNEDRVRAFDGTKSVKEEANNNKCGQVHKGEEGVVNTGVGEEKEDRVKSRDASRSKIFVITARNGT